MGKNINHHHHSQQVIKNILTPCFMFFPADLDTKGKIIRVLTAIVKFVLLLGLLYLFICSLDILSSAFQLVGGENISFHNTVGS